MNSAGGPLLLLNAPTEERSLCSPLFGRHDDQVEDLFSYETVKRHLRGYVV